MKRLLTVCIIVAASTSIFAQFDPPGITKASKAYHAYRMVETNPSYGLTKVESLIKRIKAGSDDNQMMAAKTFNTLSVPDRFTYCMTHGEVFSQNCDGMPATLGEEKMLFGHPLGPWFEENQWSDRQKSFLHHNRSAVIGLLRSTIRSNSRVGCNLKMAITELDAWELIPDLAASYNRAKKDGDILSVFFLLMKDGKFKPFLTSTTYKKIYSDEDASYKSSIAYNSENAQLTIQRAMAYYKGRKG